MFLGRVGVRFGVEGGLKPGVIGRGCAFGGARVAGLWMIVGYSGCGPMLLGDAVLSCAAFD